MILLINSDINKYIPVKYVKHNICYFKYAFKLQLGWMAQVVIPLPKKSHTPLWGRGFNTLVSPNLFDVVLFLL